MIFGIGVDSTEIARIAKSLKNPNFLAKVYSQEEQSLFLGLSTKRKEQTAASCFAAKEAFLKASGAGLGKFSLCHIEALRKQSGAPYYAFCGKAAAFVAKNGLTAHLSISHEAGIATALAVLEKSG